MNITSTLTKIQKWFRYYSKNLENSFGQSDLIDHNVKKGESREYEILDTLSKLLPTKISVVAKVVIVSASDIEARMFDGALVDRVHWPRLFIGEGTNIALVESVFSAIEVKSSLGKKELTDIFEKSKSLRSMKCRVSNPELHPLVTAFAYECDNLNLSFFDFVTHFKDNSNYSPSLICILNKGLFGFADEIGGEVIPVNEPNSNTLPILYHTHEDSLLVYVYLLSNWAGMEDDVAKVFRLYCDSLFSNMECFNFDVDFLNAVSSDETIRDNARNCFKYKPSTDIKELYTEARKAIGLS